MAYRYIGTILSLNIANKIAQSNLRTGRVSTLVADSATEHKRSIVFARWRHCERTSNARFFDGSTPTHHSKRQQLDCFG